MDEEENPHSPSQPLPDDDEHSRRNRIISNLKDSLLSELAKSNPSQSLQTRHVSSLIQQRLMKLFPSFHTPTHPPYALMIHRAISELNENNGSTEESISNFIVKEYEDLPWAHEKILNIQLENLCQDEEIVCNEGGRYVLQADGDGDGKHKQADGDVNEREECKNKRKKNRAKKRNQHSMDGGGGRKRKRVKICEVEKSDERMDGGGERKRKKVKICEEVEKSDELKVKRDEAQHQVYDLDDVRTDEPINVVNCGEREQNKSQGTGLVEQYVEAKPLAGESQLQDPIVHQKTISPSLQTALNVYQKPLNLPISECVLSKVIELSPTQMKQQMSSLDVTEQKQNGNSVFDDSEKHSPKCQRKGRLLRSRVLANNQEEFFLPLQSEKQRHSSPEAKVACQEEPTMLKNKAMLQKKKTMFEDVHNDQLHRGNQEYDNPMSGNAENRPAKRPRGRPRKSDSGLRRGRGGGRKRGRPFKIHQVANHFEQQLLMQDQDQQLQKEDQDQQNSRRRGRGRPRKNYLVANHFELKLQLEKEDQDNQFQKDVQDQQLQIYQDQDLRTELMSELGETSNPMPEPPVEQDQGLRPESMLNQESPLGYQPEPTIEPQLQAAQPLDNSAS